MKIIFHLLLLFSLCFPAAGYCQSAAIEAAKEKVYRSKTAAETLSNLLALSKLKNSMHGDSIYRYALWARELALKLKDSKAQAWATYTLISSDLAKGKTDSVIYKIDHEKEFTNLHSGNTGLYYKVYLLKANALNRSNNLPAAFSLQLKLLDEAEQDADTSSRLFVLNYLGATYLNLNKTAEAKQAWTKALQLIAAAKDTANNEIEAYILSNLALFYINTYYVSRSSLLSDSFFTVMNKAIGIARQSESLGVLASCLTIRGGFYGLLQQPAAGEKDFLEGLAIRKKIGDPFYIIHDCAGLANFYSSQKLYARCIAVAREGIDLANVSGVKGAEVFSLFKLAASAYKATGDYKQYSSTLEQFINAADSSVRINAAEKLAEIQTKYEVQKKETLIAQQKLDLFQRKILLYGLGSMTVLLLTFLLYRFRKYQRRQRLKVAAMMEEKKRQHENAVKDAEEKERRRIAAELHDNLGVQANAILHSSSLLIKEPLQQNKDLVADLQETAREMLHNLRETLWAMKTPDVSATDLWLRIINFMRQMGRHYTGIAFKVEGVSPADFTIASAQALQAVLVIQESVNNAVKHAGATVITASSINTPPGWEITITDNGKGFSMENALLQPESYGLRNMQQRAKEGNFKYHIDTAISKGTSITITLTA